ncbi:hypothetical protein ACNZAM_004279, partial [Cronobacter malonaticus]
QPIADPIGRLSDAIRIITKTVDEDLFWLLEKPSLSPEVVCPLRRAFFRLHINSASFEAFSLCQLNRKESHHDAIIAIGWRHHVRLLPD